MGTFLFMSGVIGGNEAEVVAAVRTFAEQHGGSLTQKKLATDHEHCTIIRRDGGGVTVLYPWDFTEFDDVSKFLSSSLGKPVFSFHIHDGDLWMYLLYVNGEVVDQFNPVPDYWQEISEEEREQWRGNAKEVARHIPGLNPTAIEKYLIFWDGDVIETDNPQKAYLSDQFTYGADWQLTDFANTLGLTYPVADSGEPLGNTYALECTMDEIE